jgi:hypothetical protein
MRQGFLRQATSSAKPPHVLRQDVPQRSFVRPLHGRKYCPLTLLRRTLLSYIATLATVPKYRTGLVMPSKAVKAQVFTLPIALPASMRSRLVLISLVASLATLASGATLSAADQCPAGAKIYIDPRLVPQRQHMSREQAAAILSLPQVPENQKQWVLESYYNQYQPIQMPFGNGYVMISGTDPCIQQYIGP